jgi:TRAP-type C4-dicarboxylate transport system permease large subunit
MPLGLDPIWFGVVFVIQSIARTDLAQVIRGAWPFIVIMFATIARLYLAPDLGALHPVQALTACRISEGGRPAMSTRAVFYTHGGYVYRKSRSLDISCH